MEFFRKKTSYPFMATRKRWYVVSAILVLGALLALGARGLNFGIDFTGGVVLEMSFPQAADLEKVRSSLKKAGYGDAVVQSFGTPRDVLVRMLPEAGTDNNLLGQKVLAAIQSGNPGVELRRTEVVGGQVGAELAEKGALAVLFTFFFIMLYVWMRFQWKLGVGAIVAALHDPVMILGFFAITQMTFDLPALAAILAVIGYSLNDTVVVFDRIRERFMSMRKGTSEQVIDASINETLSRTIMTSSTTMLTVLALLFFGGEILRGFSTALTIGIVVGTYSSIYVASALALDLKLTARDLLPVQKEKDAVDDMP
ncbi:MAG: protein translocase subunit SecF [Gammaproteobacteria bacterium]|nr:protein translocase subunit SecF [Gammaproteobacteria bacterium]MDH4310580.1 protein translocase subunit SecF [Gammaproteobacteria bacterium]MDH5271928.1 protein translocase subunit SecF [Gammaproteobacteria bacterium]